MADTLERRMDVAASAAWEAGKVTLRHFQTRIDVTLKEDRTPVTVADREAESVLASRLLGEFPDDAFLGEESGERVGSSGYRWTVDPIDGTKSFVQGVPLFGVLVGLEDPSGEPVVGVACLPALNELVVAGRGMGCRWNGRRCRVSDVSRIEDSCVVYTSRRTFEETSRLEALRSVQERARLCRNWGDCYGHLLVATGRAEAMLDPVLSDWDCLALLPILEEAGGTFTDWTGRRTARGRSGISTNGRVLSELQSLLGNSGPGD